MKTISNAYTSLTEMISEGAATLTADGMITHCNSRLAGILGCPGEKLIGSSLFDFAAPEELSKLKLFLRQSESETKRAEFSLKKNDGSLLAVSASCVSLMPECQGLCLVVTPPAGPADNGLRLEKRREHLEDLVEERTKALSESEERMRMLGAATFDGIILSEDGIIFEANEQAACISGYKLTEVCGRPITDFIRAEDRPRTLEIMRKGEKNIDEYVCLHKDGGELNVEVRGGTVDWKGKRVRITAVRDVTEQKRAEEALRRSEEQFRVLAENIPDMVVRLDRDLRIVYANPAVFRLAGLPEEEFSGLAAHIYGFAPDLVAAWENAAYGVFRSGEMLRCEHSSRWAGETRIFEVNMMPERDADRSVRGVLAFAHDITERKRAEDILKCDKETIEQLVREKMEELVEARLELDKGKRLSDIGVLAATVAHELRNPLAAIGLAASNIRRKAPLPLLDKHLRNISKKVAESNQIINNLLFYSRIKSPQYEKVDLSDILEEVVEVAKSKYKKSLPIILDIGPLRKARAEADPLQMKEVFFNILDNACDAVSENPDGSIRVAAACNAEAVSIRVEDSGLGMQQEILDKIFEPFFTTKSKGTGLGLCICRQIVKLHGGEIAIESESGKGTAVTVTLPRAPATPGVLSVESENRRRTG